MELAVNGLAGLRILRDVRRRDPSALRRRIDPPSEAQDYARELEKKSRALKEWLVGKRSKCSV